MASGRIDPAAGFAALGVPATLVAALASEGITDPFPIQVATLPDSLGGRDVLGRGRTGSGKTLAFAVPLVARLASGPRSRPGRPRGLVLVPTRELATQVQTALTPLATAAGLSTMTIFGGVSQRPQVTALTRGVDIVIACPGRLEDLMRQRHVHLGDVAVTVLDEADHMADLGFLPCVRRILDTTDRDGQRLLFSATLDNGVDVLVRRYLTTPVSHSVDDDARTEPDIDHHVLTVTPSDKPAVVRELASGHGRAVLFMRTKHGARKLAKDLTQAGLPAVDLHGNLSQNARDRNLAQFRDGSVRVLVATDVAARGIHVDDVALVVHVDPPTEHKAYLHRSGRTARAGASGVVVTLQTHAERRDVTAMTRRARIAPTVTDVAPGSETLLALTGPRVELVAPPVVSEPSRSQRPASPRTAPRSGSKPGRRPGARSGADRTSTRRPASGRRGSETTRTMSAADFSAGRSRGR
ncbi:MAG: DEAD/DEAH box helicase [Frankiales bacterium]|nr:DEAD/DEAH box helicase [Frankiales bacterium]